MARGDGGARRGGAILGLLNPIRDPSLLVAIILTVIEKGGSAASPVEWALFGLLNWIAVKAIIWLLVNFAFSFVFLARKAVWMARHPRLAWRLLDALGTEEIIIGGLRPDMFVTEDGSLHEGELGYAGGGGYYGALSGPAYAGEDGQYYDEREYAPRDRQASLRLDAHAEDLQELLTTYSKLLADWTDFTEEKWRAVSDSQLGWKPLRGRWNGWEQIFADAFGLNEELPDAGDPMMRRFEHAQTKGSAASAVACFLHDLDSLRQGLAQMQNDGPQVAARIGGLNSQAPVSQRTGKAPIIRNPMIVEAD